MNNNLVFTLLLTALLVAPGLTIFLPLTGRSPRCMIIYTVGASETVKLNINFPPLPSQLQEEFYEISWTNTETKEVSMQSIPNGKFKRELTLAQNVIYDVCMKVESRRDFGVVLVDYSSTNVFAVNTAQVKVPENLLKEKDITDCFLNAQSIEKSLDSFVKLQQQKSQTHAKIFSQTNKISEKLIQISVVEVIVIIGAGIFQFWSLWKYLKGQSYV